MNPNSSSTSVFTMESYLIEQWSYLQDIYNDENNLSNEQKKILQAIDINFKNNRVNIDLQDPDALMLWMHSRYLVQNYNDCHNILNQVSLFFFFIIIILFVL